MSIEAMKLALEALEYFSDTSPTMAGKAHAEDAITALRQAIAEAEKQEPVEMPPIKFSQVADGIEVGYDLFGGVDIRLGGEFVYVHINYNYKYTDNATRTHLANSIVELLTNKPQREWVGLTKEEVKEISFANRPYVVDMVVALEAKLKEKNT